MAELLAKIDGLNNYFQACVLMEQEGIDLEHVDTLEKAKTKLRIYAGRRENSRISQPVRQYLNKL